MDFRSELAKWGYNKGNSIDVETLIDEILPEILSQQKRMYSEDEVRQLLEYAIHESRMQDDKTEDYILKDALVQFKKK